MDQALVAALGRDLRRRKLGAIDEAFRIALAKRDMASRILVEQCVEEQQPAFRDRRGMRHQRYFAEPARAFVGIEHLVQHLLAARGLGLDDAAAFEPHRDIVDQRTLIGQRLGAHDMPVDPPGVRRGEDLLGRNVGIAGDAVVGGGGAAFPFVAIGKPDRQVGAGSRIVQRAEALSVQPFGAVAQRGVVLFPRGDGVVIVDARGGEDGVGELCRPRRPRHRRGKPASPMTRSDRRRCSS